MDGGWGGATGRTQARQHRRPAPHRHHLAFTSSPHAGIPPQGHFAAFQLSLFARPYSTTSVMILLIDRVKSARRMRGDGETGKERQRREDQGGPGSVPQGHVLELLAGRAVQGICRDMRHDAQARASANARTKGRTTVAIIVHYFSLTRLSGNRRRRRTVKWEENGLGDGRRKRI